MKKTLLITIIILIITVYNTIAVNTIVYSDTYSGLINDAGTTTDGIVFTGVGHTAYFAMDSYQDFMWCECIDYNYFGTFVPDQCNCYTNNDKTTCQNNSTDFNNYCTGLGSSCYSSGAGGAYYYGTANRFSAKPAIRYYTNCDTIPSIWQVIANNNFYGIDAKQDTCTYDGSNYYNIQGRYDTSSWVTIETNEQCDSSPLNLDCDTDHDNTVITSQYYNYDDDACKIAGGSTSYNRCDLSSECWNNAVCNRNYEYQMYYDCQIDKKQLVDVDWEHFYYTCGGSGYNDWDSSTVENCYYDGETTTTVCDEGRDNIYTQDDFSGGMEIVCNLNWTNDCSDSNDGLCHSDWSCNNNNRCSECYNSLTYPVNDTIDCNAQYPYCTGYSSTTLLGACFNNGGVADQQECACCQQVGIEDTCLEGTTGQTCEFQSECASGYYCDLTTTYTCQPLKTGNNMCNEDYECVSNDCDRIYEWQIEYSCNQSKYGDYYNANRTHYNKTCNGNGLKDYSTVITIDCTTEFNNDYVCDNDRTPLYTQTFNWQSGLICKVEYNKGCTVNNDCVLDYSVCNDYWNVCGECNTNNTEHDLINCPTNLPYCTGLTPLTTCDTNNSFICSCCQVTGIIDYCLQGIYNESCEHDDECIQGLFCNLPAEDKYITQILTGFNGSTPQYDYYYSDLCQYDLYDCEETGRPKQCWSNKTFTTDYYPLTGYMTENKTYCGECFTGYDCINNKGILNSNYCYLDNGYPGGYQTQLVFNDSGITICKCKLHNESGYNPPGCDSGGFCFGKEKVGAYVDCPAECETNAAVYVGGLYPYECAPNYEISLTPKNLVIEDNITITFTPVINYSIGYPPTYGCWEDTFTNEKWCYAVSSSYCLPGCNNYTYYINTTYDTTKNYELERYATITFKTGMDNYYDIDTSINCWKTNIFWCDETCDDGILNRDETNIDYGGSCGTCFDNIQSFLIGETNIDYGGICGTCYDKIINIVYGISVFNETEIDYGGDCGYCAENITKAEDNNWILARILQNKNERFNFENCKNSQQIIIGATFILLIILLLGGLFIFLIIVILLIIIISSSGGLLGLVVRKGISYIWTKIKKKRRKTIGEEEEITEKE